MTVAVRPASETLTVERLDLWQDNNLLANAWNTLAGGNPFLTWQWLDCWWRHYGAQPGDTRCESFVIAIRDGGGNLVGLAPWYLEHSLLNGRTVRFLGSGEVCSDYLTVLCQSVHQQGVIDGLVGWLLNECGSRWDFLDFKSVAATDPFLAALTEQLERNGCNVFLKSTESCWRITLPDSWQTYLRSLSKSRREKVRQLHRQLLQTGKAVLHQVTTPAELETGFSILQDLHQSRRNSLGQAGCFASSRFGAFHRETCERLLRQHQLQLNWTSIDGVPAAVEYSFKCDNTVYYYQSGIAPEMVSLQPGWLSVTSSIHSAISAKYRYFDLLRGDEPYKASLGAEPRTMTDILVSNPRLPARVRRHVRQGISMAKAIVKRVR